MSNELKPLKIGNVKLNSNLILAPLAGFTDVAFRRLCRDEGAGLTVTEMVSVKGLCYKNVNTASLLQTAKNEVPSCVQLFGSDPNFFTRALEMPELNGFDIIDINMGCPMPKVTKNGDGSALLRNIKQASAVTAAAVIAAQKLRPRPVSVKIRIGQAQKSINAVEMARAIEDSGAQLITVHGRTAVQLYGGLADWDIIGKVALSVKIPVIGNGDVFTKSEATEKIRVYGVSGIMIGRGAIGNPQIFSSTQNKNALELIKKHIAYMQEYFPERYIITNIRKHIPYYLKGMHGVKELKQAFNCAQSIMDLLNLLEHVPSQPHIY